ncbi:MAG TPA: hypothetical protein VFQ20_04565 [Burkholderiaceae bacterium]|nr:hypothetical protein [Burkholderiaceae bacterium]
MDFDAFVAQAWADHADDAAGVAARLRTDTPAPATPAQLEALVRLTVHVVGEHLGAFEDARWRLAALANHTHATPSVQSALRVALAAIDLAEAGRAALAGFTDAEVVRTQSAAAALCVGQGRCAAALDFIAAARQRLAQMPGATPADHRPVAVHCHNMAWVLHDRGVARTPAETAAMLDLAAASRAHWEKAGTWLEVERGEYDLARMHLAAGQCDAALRHAAQCLAACIAHDAPPYEVFFGHEALALVQHARGDRAALAHHVRAAQDAFDRLADADQAACRKALDAVRALEP